MAGASDGLEGRMVGDVYRIVFPGMYFPYTVEACVPPFEVGGLGVFSVIQVISSVICL